mgnify:CR=1 FL=1
MKNKEWLISFIYWIHLPFVLIWLGLFFVPSSVWSYKINFHFWYAVSLTIIQFLWALCIFQSIRKLGIICPLTSLMQYLRGYPFRSPKNYSHTYIAEVSNRLHIKINDKSVNILTLATLGIIILQFVFQ